MPPYLGWRIQIPHQISITEISEIPQNQTVRVTDMVIRGQRRQETIYRSEEG